MASREERIAEARQIILESKGELGKDKINALLRDKYGEGLRRKDIGELKRELKPEIFGRLTVREKRQAELLDAGFLPTEARQLSTVALYSPAMQSYIARRKAFIKAERAQGSTQKEISKSIRKRYKEADQIQKGRIVPLERFKRFVEHEALEDTIRKQAHRIHTLAQHRVYERLIKSGFLDFEAREMILGKGKRDLPMSDAHLSKAFNSKVWQDAMKNRMAWIRDKQKKGWTKAQIRKEIRRWYKADPKASPYDFIREYIKLKKKVKDFTAAEDKRATSASKRVKKAYGEKIWSRL